MSNIKKLSLVLLFMMGTVATYAQDTDDSRLRSIYEKAEVSYDIGRLEDAQQILTDNLKSFSGSLRQSAYRLLSLCSLGLDDEVAAEDYVRQLLNENPYYSTTLSDPQRFIDMVGRISGRAEGTITTASSHEERLSEVPVPTTLITEQMIRDCGACNLQEVLATYVPGMNIVDCNSDTNIAMRGIFSNGQEKILIMLDGHRLNSYCTNTASPNFSISLEKLKQIEVLRGPASSLYGGVALTAVVNLITKKGADVDGARLKAGYGNYGQLKVDALFGKRYYDLDMMMWGSLYRSSGQLRNVPETDATIGYTDQQVTVGCVGPKPSFDIGISLRWKDLQFLYDTKFSQERSPYTISTAVQPYDYDRYRTYNGLHPGFATNSHHADLKYGHQIGKVVIDGSLFYANSDLTQYQVVSDDTIPWLGEIFEMGDDLSAIFENHGGISRYINGQEQTFGAQVKGDYNYISAGSHSGFLTFGMEYSHFQLDDVRYTIGYDFVYSTPENALLSQLGKGNEKSYNAFLQLKHHWRDFIFNAGLRYDHKARFDDSRVNELSPRLALIYLRPKWNVKLSYSRSFVDAPYLYQKTNIFLDMLSGKQTADGSYSQLRPETLRSLQLTFAGTQWLPGLDIEMNLFHNRAQDLIFTQVITHMNSGDNKAIGAEFMAGYKRGRLSANLNATWMKTLKSNLLYKDIDDNNSTPRFTSNLTLGWQATPCLRLHTKAAFQGRQTAYNISETTMIQIVGLLELMEEEKDLDVVKSYLDTFGFLINDKLVSSDGIASRIVFDLGAEYRLGKVSLGIDIHNLLNRKYNQGGMNTGLVPQRGCWFLASLGLEI